MNNVVMTGKTLEAMSTWARTLCILMLGAEEGERYWRTLPAKTVLVLWVMFNRTE